MKNIGLIGAGGVFVTVCLVLSTEHYREVIVLSSSEDSANPQGLPETLQTNRNQRPWPVTQTLSLAILPEALAEFVSPQPDRENAYFEQKVPQMTTWKNFAKEVFHPPEEVL